MVTALIAGGGIAGPVAAMALQRAGIEAVVYEAHVPSTGDAGSYLTVATNGLDALRAIDADRAVLANGFPTPTNLLLSATGRRLGGAEATDGGGVVAEFHDGTRAAGDLLVGADGVHSVTRRLLDPAAPAGRYVGLVNFGGYTPDSAGVAEPGAWHMIFGRRAFFGYVVDPGGGTVWFANVPRPAVTPAERAATSPEQWKGQLLELFTPDHGPATDLIAAGTLELAGDSTHDLPSVPAWHKGPMVIVGDAAHAPSPTSGQGASMAAEDAVVLAKCLRDLPGIPDALAAYERLRRSRVERIVAQGARTGSAKTAGPVGRLVRDLALPLVFRFLVTERSTAWIYRHHIDWAAPVERPAQRA